MRGTSTRSRTLLTTPASPESPLPWSLGGLREVLGDLEEAAARLRIHVIGHVDLAAGSQVRIEWRYDHSLAATGELLRQDGASPLVGVPIGVVEHQDRSVK